MKTDSYFEECARALQYIAAKSPVRFQIQVAAERIEYVWSKNGRIITTGMGKAGHIARKFASTLASVGFEAFYIHPGEAAHGDLGMIGERDMLFALSNSGKTLEVLSMLEQARALQHGDIDVVAISQAPGHMVFGQDDIGIGLPDFGEWDEDGLVPTLSMVIMLAVCDAVAMTARDRCGLGKEDFARRHHGGYLGEKARG